MYLKNTCTKINLRFGGRHVFANIKMKLAISYFGHSCPKIRSTGKCAKEKKKNLRSFRLWTCLQ